MVTEADVREEGCFAIAFGRKYYHCGGASIKRSLKPNEFRSGFRGPYVPQLRKEGRKNEAPSLRYVHRHTDIPVPTVSCDFEDDDASCLYEAWSVMRRGRQRRRPERLVGFPGRGRCNHNAV